MLTTEYILLVLAASSLSYVFGYKVGKVKGWKTAIAQTSGFTKGIEKLLGKVKK